MATEKNGRKPNKAGKIDGKGSEKVVRAEYNEKGETLPPRSKKSKILGVLFRVILAAALFCIAIGITGGVCFFYILENYENISIANAFKTLNMNETTYIYAYDSEMGTYVEVESLFMKEDRKWLSYGDIPADFIKATIAIEDERFYEHKGVDWPRFMLATVNSFLHFRGRFGASTITMQLVKNVTQQDQSTWQRKLGEVFNATYLEKIYSKEDILELYLNYINYGGQLQGIMSASRFYFNTDPSQLSLIEICSIVGITNNPSLYNPYYAENREANLERAKLIASLMYEQEMISEEQYNEAMATTELVFSFTSSAEEDDGTDSETSANVSSAQSYYVDAVIEELLSDLQKKNGVSAEVATSMLYQGGLKIYIPMDMTVQNIMDGYYSERSNFPDKTCENPYTNQTDKIQSAMMIMNYKTGDVLGIVGGIGVKEYARGFNRATSAFRQVGSVIKPIAVYAPAIEYNVADGASALHDMPNGVDGNWPVNFTDLYRGNMPLRRALAMSLNGPTVDLAMQLGPQNSFDFLTQKCGVKNLVSSVTVNGQVISDITLSLSLGGVTYGLTVTEICSAYQIFPNNGIYNEPRFYTNVTDNLGNTVLEKTIVSNIALSPQTAFIMRDLLYELVYDGFSSNARFSTTAGEKITCYGKTGTAAGDHDLWFCGFTSELLGCVWMGFDCNEPAHNIGSEQCAVLWSKVMRSIYDAKDLHDGSFEQPTGVKQVTVCKYSGKLATDYCELDPRNTEKNPVTQTCWVKTENVPTEECSLHYPVYICEESGKIAHDNCPNGSVYAVGLMNEYRVFTRTDLYIEDAQYVLPKLSPDTVLYVSDRLPVSMNLYNNTEGFEKYIGTKNSSHANVTVYLPGLPMKNVATANVMNAICTAHTPAEFPKLHPYNFTGVLITTPTHIVEPEEPDTSSVPPESSSVSSEPSEVLPQ